MGHTSCAFEHIMNNPPVNDSWTLHHALEKHLMTFASSPRPGYSMWGRIDFAVELVPGIWVVSTPSHGGLILSDERQQSMPAALRLEGNQYEEDCNWSLVYLAFESELAALPDPYEPERVRMAHDTAGRWHADRYAAFRAATGITATP
jgi:hypothetical protein